MITKNSNNFIEVNKPKNRYIISHILLGSLSFISIFPIYWMFITSLRPENKIYSSLLWPENPTIANYVYAINTVPVIQMLVNTFLFAVGSTVFGLIVALFASYAFARWKFIFSRVIFTLVAMTWLVPFQVIMIPNFVTIANFGLIDTVIALILPNIASAFAIMLLYQAMKSFPTEILEAAYMDGAGHWKILWKVITPNLKAPLAALGILLFISSWNEYFWPLLLTRSPDSTVIQIGINMFLTSEGDMWGPLMAVATMACVPVLIIYVLLQRQVIDSFVKAGLK